MNSFPTILNSNGIMKQKKVSQVLLNSFYQDLIKLIESVIDIMVSARSQLNDFLGTLDGKIY